MASEKTNLPLPLIEPVRLTQDRMWMGRKAKRMGSPGLATAPVEFRIIFVENEERGTKIGSQIIRTIISKYVLLQGSAQKQDGERMKKRRQCGASRHTMEYTQTAWESEDRQGANGGYSCTAPSQGAAQHTHTH